MVQPTPLYELVQRDLRKPLVPWVRELRTQGLTWRQIATTLQDETGHAVSHETLRVWYQAQAA